MNISKKNIFLAFLTISMLGLVSPDTVSASDNTGDPLPSLVTKIKPSVVTIIVYDKNGKPFKQGTGWFYKDNYVITNRHVLLDGTRVEIILQTQERVSLQHMIFEDEIKDIAILGVFSSSMKSFPPSLKLSRKTPVEGESIFVIGTPLGLDLSVSEGIVSSMRETKDAGKIIQFTAPVSPGSSGSPVINQQGEVLGMVWRQIETGQQLNFAICSSEFDTIVIDQSSKIPLPVSKMAMSEDINSELNAIFTSQVAFFGENNRYAASFSELLWAPGEDSGYAFSLQLETIQPSNGPYVLPSRIRPMADLLVEFVAVAFKIEPGLFDLWTINDLKQIRHFTNENEAIDYFKYYPSGYNFKTSIEQKQWQSLGEMIKRNPCSSYGNYVYANVPETYIINIQQPDPEVISKIYSCRGEGILHFVVYTKRKDICAIILEKGANVNSLNSDGITPLVIAVENDDIDMANLLIRNGADPNTRETETSMSPILYSKSVGMVQVLVKAGANINDKTATGQTLLLFTAAGDNTSLAGYLISNGINVNEAEQGGITPLMLAVYNEKVKMTQLLIQRGADVNLQTNDKEMDALYNAAVLKNNLVMVKYLISKKANVNQKYGEDAVSLLHILALDDKYIEAAKIIIGSGATINARENKWGDTPLIFAAHNGAIGMVSLLLTEGADPNTLNKIGCSALDAAIAGGYSGIGDLLVKRGAKEGYCTNRSQQSRRSVERPWRQLQQGLTKQQVLQLMGEPNRIIKYSVIGESWYYENGGQINFDPNGRVNGWTEPY